MPILGKKFKLINLTFLISILDDNSRLRIFLYKVWLLLYDINNSFNFDRFFVKVLPTKITMNLNIMRKQELFPRAVEYKYRHILGVQVHGGDRVPVLGVGVGPRSVHQAPGLRDQARAGGAADVRAGPGQSKAISIFYCAIFSQTRVSGREHQFSR